MQSAGFAVNHLRRGRFMSTASSVRLHARFKSGSNLIDPGPPDRLFYKHMSKTISDNSTRGVLFFLLAWLAGFTTAFGANTIKGKDGTVELKVPDGWKRSDPPANSPDVIQLMGTSAKTDMGVIVQVEDASASTMSLEDYAKAVEKVYQQKFKDVTVTDPKAVKVQGEDAERFEIKCSINGIKLGYVITALKLDSHFEQVVGWAVQSDLEKDRSTLSKLADGLKTTFDQAKPADAAPAGQDVVLKDADSTVQITLPSGWAGGKAPNTVKIMALNTKLDLGVMVTVESRVDSTMDLKDYAKTVGDQLIKSPAFSDTSKTDPKPVKVNGQDALQFEFRATRTKIKLAYLITVFQSDKNFLRVTGWSTESKFEKSKPALSAAADGVKELAGEK